MNKRFSAPHSGPIFKSLLLLATDDIIRRRVGEQYDPSSLEEALLAGIKLLTQERATATWQENHSMSVWEKSKLLILCYQYMKVLTAYERYWKRIY